MFGTFYEFQKLDLVQEYYYPIPLANVTILMAVVYCLTISAMFGLQV